MTSNYQKKFYKNYEELQGKYDCLALEYKFLKDSEQRYRYAEVRKTKQVKNLKADNKEFKKWQITKRVRTIKTHENIDGTQVNPYWQKKDNTMLC